jgi:TPR repeat protein
MYINGRGVPRDYAEALRLSRLAADQGFAAAQYSLAFAYANGQGVPQDYAEAVKWSWLAADQGYALAQYYLGIAYGNGQGVPQDLIQSYKWFEVAAAHGYKDAIQGRQAAAERMSGAQIAEAQKLAREWQPTKQQLLR